ncbi:hypothetical protein [Fibrobacter sp.]|uniref:hypothetical protein n=1 Tax=Fibrobacter sp. TaxID=35828 RepID=UPI003868C535
MNIRKHWKNLLLTTTAFFWASCTSENTAQPLYGVYCPPEGCGDPELSSSSDVPLSSSSDAASSSSEFNAPSSSSVEESSSSAEALSSSSSAEVTCTPGDSTISYYGPSYSADIAKMNAEERAKRTGFNKVDSIHNTLLTPPQCLADLRQQLNDFVALYGAPVRVIKDEVCSDGTTRPTKEYQEYLQMKEEWEANKPALDAECQKIYEDKLKNIEEQINKCLSKADTTKKIACEIDAMCPVYGTNSTCSYNYRCEDGAECWDSANNTIRCTDESGNSVTYTEEEFKAKYYGKRRYY